MVYNFHKHIHHAKKRLKHPEIKGIIILGILTLAIPLLVIILSFPTKTKQEAAGTTQCETNGDVCVPAAYVGQGALTPGQGGCSNGQSPLTNYSCNTGYVCCRPGVAFPNGQGGNQCGNCQGQTCPNAGQYCEQPTAQNNQFAIYLCNQTNGIWQFQYNQTGSNTCTWSTPGSTGPINTGTDTCTPSGGICVKSGVNCSSLTTATNPGSYIPSTAGQCLSGQSCCMPGGNNTVGGGQGTWQCNKNYACVNSQTGVVDNTKCTPKCAPPPPTCTCQNSGQGYPNNKYTCTDPKLNGQCGYYSLCDNTVGGTRPCKAPQPPLCVCTNPGLGVKVGLFGINFISISGLNGYSCGDDPNKVRACGLAKDGSPDICGLNENNMGVGISQLPTAPCNSNGKPSTSTASPVAVFATLSERTTPLSSVPVSLNLVKPLAASTTTLAENKVLAAQTITITDNLKYDNKTGRYYNTNFNFDNVPTGDYLIFAKVDGYLASQVKDQNGNQTISIAPDKVFLPQQITFIPGDVAPQPHGDNFIDINDYNALLNCYGRAATGTCKTADLNGDGTVDDKDLEILIGNFDTFGDSYTEPSFTCTTDPTCKSGVGSIQLCSLKCTKVIDF